MLIQGHQKIDNLGGGGGGVILQTIIFFSRILSILFLQVHVDF